MKIGVIGTGYVGLVAGTCFAEAGNIVTCVDVDEKKIRALNDGHIPIYEPGLSAMVQANLKGQRLKFTTELDLAINQSDLAFIAVGTPPNEDGSADLKHVLEVVHQIARLARKKIIIGIKSTVPVGTGDIIEEIFAAECQQEFVVFSNPEFLKEGDAINDFMKPHRVIIGLNDSRVVELIRELYEPFTQQKDKLIVMRRRSAEITKYAANAMLATRISFMNEMANLCEKIGADIHEVRLGIGSDPRIGASFLYSGLGYGGSCFPKDVKAILQTADRHSAHLHVISAAEQANDDQKQIMFEKIVRHFGGVEQLKGKTLALWGLAFKANTDDIRESPAIVLAQALTQAQARVVAFDPEASANSALVLTGNIHFADSAYDCLPQASALIIATDWYEFRSPDFERMKSLMTSAVIFDGRNILNQDHALKLGFTYYGIGRLLN